MGRGKVRVGHRCLTVRSGRCAICREAEGMVLTRPERPSPVSCMLLEEDVCYQQPFIRIRFCPVRRQPWKHET
jgi:hypothetical protein